MKNIMKSGLLLAMVLGLVACEQQTNKKHEKKGSHPKKGMVSQQVEAPKEAEVAQ